MSDATIPVEPAPDTVRAAVEAIVASEALAGAERLQGFLRYVVGEALDGRAHLIRAKTIALDLYGYSVDEVARRENVVRVDAGRLRRRLEDYYADEGRGALITIALPKGSYAPQITVADEPGEPVETATSHLDRRRVFILLGVLCVGVLAVLAWSLRASNAPQPSTGLSPGLEREAIFNAAPKRLQAINLAEDGRDLLFPAVNLGRLQAALLVFESAIAHDDRYFGGFAGLAQVRASLAMLREDASVADGLIAEAIAASDRALELAPSAAWSHSARAWVEFIRGEPELAIGYTKRALSLDSNDPHIVEFDALISLFTGHFERLFEVAEQAIGAKAADAGFVFQNALGSAQYHTGDFNGALATYERAVAEGAPTGPVSIAYMMAAHHRLGHDREARELARQYRKNWPTQRVDLLLARLFVDEAYGADLADGMRGAGWAPAEP